jgi:hypothetical protein
MLRAGVAVLLTAAGFAVLAPGASADRVLRVGSWHGVPGEFSDVQAAINAAAPNDWVLVAPGDYHEANTLKPPGAHGDDRAGAGVLIRKAGLWLRGMNRNTVWIDGTKPGSKRCSAADSAQDFGPRDSSGNPGGRNGILIYKAPGVIVDNLSLCNFLHGDLGGGNQIWWDGGASTGTQTSLGVWWGSYLTATSSYFKDPSSPSAGYGIYSSNTKAPGYGLFAHDFASNMNDSAYYVGACPDCNVTLNDIRGENSPQGYSGTNSGGHIVIENSEFDHNMVGFATGDLNNDDAPGPQDGTCPGNALNPHSPAGIQRTHVCWVFTHNYVHDNNNANVPSAGIAAAVPAGSGILLYGGRHDVITRNRIVRNGAWGIIFTPYPDTEQPPSEAHCGGGEDLSTPGSPLCYYDDWGTEIAHNTFSNNGFFGNPSNGDIGELSQAGGSAGPNYNPDSNCFHDNPDTAGSLTSDPSNIDSYDKCGTTYPPANDPVLTAQLACDTQLLGLQLLGSCPAGPGANYPRASSIALKMPPPERTMPNPCSGVPADPWCSGQVTSVPVCVGGGLRVPATLVPGDRLVRFTARIVGTSGAWSRHGRVLVVSVAPRRGQRFRVRFTEQIAVRRHHESFSFTNVYRAC